MNYIKLSLQKIAWQSTAKGTSGEDWAYSNRKPQKTVNFFGDESTGFTISRLKRGAKKIAEQSEDMVTIWLNGVTDAEAELYRSEYGDEVYVDSDDNLITVERYQELMSSTETSDEVFAE